MTPLKRQFFRYALPSMLSQLLNSCFIIVDGFFIGRNLGDIGLAAINVAWPITAFIQAVSLGLGLGGAVRLSTALGRGDKEEAALARGNTLTALAAAGVAMSVGLWLACPVILPLIGAKGELYAPALEYSRMICALALGQTINTGVLPLLRGSHKTIQAMSFTIVGLLGNIFMDWLFIQAFQWGLAGAAVATGSAQILCAVLALPCLLASRELPLRRADFAPRWGMLRRIVQYGVSPFGLSISRAPARPGGLCKSVPVKKQICEVFPMLGSENRPDCSAIILVKKAADFRIITGFHDEVFTALASECSDFGVDCDFNGSCHSGCLHSV